MAIQMYTYSPRDQEAVKNFILTQLKEFGFSYQQNLDYDLSDPEKYYLQEGGIFYVLKEENKIIGTIAVINKGNNIAELKRLYVDQEYRGKKLGSLLVDKAIDFCREHGFKKVEFETNKKFQKAHLLYLHRGFHIVKEDTESFYMEKEM